MENNEPIRARHQPRQPLVLCYVGLALGIVIDRWISIPLATWLLVGGFGVTCGWVAGRREHLIAGTLLLLVGVVAAGGAWHHVRWNGFRADDVGFWATEDATPICLVAVATTSPRLRHAPPRDPLETYARGDRTQFEVRALKIRDGAKWVTASGRARLTVEGHLLNVHAGDRIEILASLTATTSPRNPGEFDYATFERSHGRLCHLHASHPACIRLLSSHQAVSPASFVENIRNQ